MADESKPPEQPETEMVSRSVRWLASDLERIEQAAVVLGLRERLQINASDIIRRGALREADGILAVDDGA